MTYGTPHILISDNGRQFHSECMIHTLNSMVINYGGVLLISFAGYSGTCEPDNASPNLKVFSQGSNLELWQQNLYALDYAYRATKVDSHVHSAFFLFGCRATFPCDYIWSTAPIQLKLDQLKKFEN